MVIGLKLLKRFRYKLIQLSTVFFPDIDQRCGPSEIGRSNAEFEVLDKVFDQALRIWRRFAVRSCVMAANTRTQKENAITTLKRLSNPKGSFVVGPAFADANLTFFLRQTATESCCFDSNR